MTDEEEQHLRARVEDWRRRLPDAAKDIDTLLAEVDRLRELLQTTRGALADIATMTGRETADGIAQRKARRTYEATK